MTKKIISMILAIAMILSVFAGIAMTATAASVGDTFVKISSMDQLTDGQYLIVGATTTGNYIDKIGTMLTGNSGFMGYETPEIIADGITLDDEHITVGSVWTIKKQTDGTFTVADNTGAYLSNAGDTKNTANVAETAEALTIASGADVAAGTFTITRASGTYIYLNWNYNSGVSRFAFYKAQNNTSSMCAYFTLYKLGATACDHADAIGTVTTEATCISLGEITYTCSCGGIWYEAIDMIDHNYQNGICTMCGDELPAGTEYTLVSMDNIPAGNYIIASTRKSSYDTLYPATATVNNDWTVSDTAVKASNDVIVSGQLPSDAQIFSFTGNNTDGFTVSCEVDGAKQYLGYKDAASSRTLALSADYSDILWRVIEDKDGGFALSCVNTKYVISDNSDSATSIRGYINGTVYVGLYLFVEAAEDGVCMHGKTEIRNAVAATCTENGYSGDTYCALCEEKLSEGKSIAALGHSFADGVCSLCGANEESIYFLISLDSVSAGNYIIASTRKSTYETLYPATAAISTYWTVSNTAICAENDTITSAQLPEDAQVFTFTGNNTDGFAISCVVDGVKQYLGYSDATANNALALSADYADILWNVIEDADGGFALSSATEDGAYVISDNSTAATSIRGYASGKIYTGIYLFAEYDPNGECAHGATEIKNAVAATCTESGYSGDTYCALCGEKLSDGKTVAALGHSYANDVCTVCGAKEEKSYGLVSLPNVSAGKYVIASTRKSTYETLYAATAAISGYWSVSETAISATNDTITSAQLPEDAQVFTFTGNNTDGFAISCEVDGVKQYLGYSDAAENNTLALSADYASILWTVIEDADGGFALSSATEDGAYVISDNSTAATSIRGYASGKVYNGIYLFKEGLTPDAEIEAELDETLAFTMNISVGAAMSVSYNVMASAVSKYADFYLEVSKANADGEPTVVTYGLSEGHEPMTNLMDFIYSATYEGIAAKQMGDEFSTTLYAIDANGKLYKGETVTESIKDYLVAKASEENATDAFKTMAVDMLSYGAQAQKIFSYGTDNLVTDGLSKTLLSFATTKTPSATDISATGGTGASVSVNVTVGSKVELGLSVMKTGLSKPDSVRCEIRDAEGNLIAEPTVANAMDMIFSAGYSEVGAREMRKPITATFYMGDDAISQTITWSVESYVAQVRANENSTENDIAMVNAMLAYGDSVGAYLTSIGQ